MKTIKLEIKAEGTLDQVATRLLDIARAIQVADVYKIEVQIEEFDDGIIELKIED